jgi:DNA-binding transcriptional LysR family regulator
MSRDAAFDIFTAMDLHHMRHVIAVAEHAHFGRAAEHLGMAQPPLSQSIRRLERELGVVLFERDRRGARATPAGQAFIAEARAALAAAERATRQARAAATQRRPVAIGLVSAATWGPVPDLLRVAHQAGIPVELHESTTERQLELLGEGQLDLAFVSPPWPAIPRLKVHELEAQPLVAALPDEGGRWPEGKPVPLARLAEGLILFPRPQGPALHDAILSLFRTRGLDVRVVQESGRMPTILALVAAGLGAALVPAGVARALAVKGVAFRPVDGPGVPHWPLSLVHLPLLARGTAALLVGHWTARVRRPTR